MIKTIRSLLLLLIPSLAFAHPGGGLIALNANAVIFGDPVNNVLWRLEKDRGQQALMTKLHVHWTTLGLDGRLYAESFGEMGGALFRIDLAGIKHERYAEERDVKSPVFAVGKSGEIVFQKGGQIIQRSAGGRVESFRRSGKVAKGEPPLQQVMAYAWGTRGDLYIADGPTLRRIGADGVIRVVTTVDGKLIEPRIWNATNTPQIWSIAVDKAGRLYTALPHTGQVLRIDPDGSKHVIVDQPADGWRVTAVAAYGNDVFLLESSGTSNAGQRVRVLRGAGVSEVIGQITPP